MALLNKLFWWIILILSAGAAFLSFRLFERRNEFRGRADKLAASVAEIVQDLDKGSGTNVAGSVDFSPADRENKTPESGALGWAAYHEAKDEDGSYAQFGSTLKQATGLAKTVNSQRNDLAASLSETVAALGIPEDEASKDALANCEKYKDAASRAKQHAEAVAERDSSIIETLVACGKVLGTAVDTAALTSRPVVTDDDGNQSLGFYKCAPVLSGLSSGVTRLNGRCSDYADSLAGAISQISKHDWETNPDTIKNKKSYETALTSLANDFQSINGKLASLAKTQMQLDETKAKLEEREEELERKQGELANEQDRNKELQLTLARIRRENPEIGGPDIDLPPGELTKDPTLEGRVVQVNKDWNFVILNLGSDKVKEDWEMLVARDDQLIAKLHISKVMRDISIGEVLLAGRVGDIKEDDRVIFPDE